MYMYVCVYVYIYMQYMIWDMAHRCVRHDSYIYNHIYIYVYVYVYIHICMCVYICSTWLIHTQSYIYIRICICIYMYMHMYINIYAVHDSCIYPDTNIIYIYLLIRQPPSTHDSFKCATWLIHMCDMTHVDTLMYTHAYMHMYIHSYMYIHTYLIYTHRIFIYSYLCTSTPTVKHPENKGLIQMCDMTHLYVRHDSTYILNDAMTHPLCDITYSDVGLGRDSSICATWLIHICDTTHIYIPAILVR